MNRYKKMELSDYLNNDVVLKRYHCFNPYFEIVYNEALSNNIELQYHKKNLLKYVKEQKKSLLESKSHEKTMKNFEKKEKILLLKQCLFRIFVVLSLYSCHAIGKNMKIQEESNVVNTYMMLNYLAQDTNDDEILEINTELLNYINEYSNPGDDNYFYNTNFIYRLSDNVQIADCLSFDIAMDKLEYDLIEIDGVIYSKTGSLSKISFNLENEQRLKYTSLTFENESEIKSFLANSYNCEEEDISSVTINTNEVKDIDEIPTIKKSKKDGVIFLNESSAIKQKVLRKFIN